MKKAAICVVLFLALLAISNVANAETILVSAPLTRGDNGYFKCVCSNIGKKVTQLQVDIVFDRESTSTLVSGGPLRTVLQGATYLISSAGTSHPHQVAYCQVTGSPSPTTKKVPCTFSAVDSNGSPQVTVPVNLKRKF